MITPLLHHVMVKPLDFAESNKDVQRLNALGLIMAVTDDLKRAQASVDVGVVVSLGSIAYKDYGIEPPIQVGDRVNYARFSGKIVSDPETGEDFICLNDSDVLCIVKG